MKMEVSNLMKDRIKNYLMKGKRFDGRKTDQYRDLEIETGVSKNAEGSARVKLGDTEVLVGVKIDVATPYTDHENEGTLITTVELLPLASNRFESGPPRIESVEIARVIDRGIRESRFIDFKKLCIKEGEKVYAVLLDIYPINHDGNLIDAGFIGAVAALLTAKLPKYDEKTEKIKYGELTSKNLPVNDIPIVTTVYKSGKNLFVDPILEEQDSVDARLSIAMTKNKKIYVNALQKGGEGTFTEKEINDALDLAAEKYEEIVKKIEKAVK